MPLKQQRPGSVSHRKSSAAGAHVRTAGGGGSIDDLLAELGDVGAASRQH